MLNERRSLRKAYDVATQVIEQGPMHVYGHELDGCSLLAKSSITLWLVYDDGKLVDSVWFNSKATKPQVHYELTHAMGFEDDIQIGLPC